MPNWCENELKVSGDKKELSRFKKFAKEGKEILSANKFIPYPKEFKDGDDKRAMIEKKQDAYQKSLISKGMTLEEARNKTWKKYPYIKDGFNSGGYGWCIANWGTKWDFCRAELEDSKEDLFYHFDTAWSPPMPVIKAMGEMFTNLKFALRYFEGGMGFNGLFQMENGRVISNLSGDYYGNRGG